MTKQSEESEPNYQWRPACKADIGSVARFGDTDSNHEPWSYGILIEITKCETCGWLYKCDDGIDINSFMYCQIQYDANQEP